MARTRKMTEAQVRARLNALLAKGWTLLKASEQLGISYERARKVVGNKKKDALPPRHGKGITDTSPGQVRAPVGAPVLTQALVTEMRAYFVSHFLLGHDFHEAGGEFMRITRVVWQTMTVDPEVLTLAAQSGIPYPDNREWPEVDFDKRYLEDA